MGQNDGRPPTEDNGPLSNVSPGHYVWTHNATTKIADRLLQRIPAEATRVEFMKLSYDAGEPCALKGASTVRGRPVRTVLKSNALAAYPTSRAEANPGDPAITSLLTLVVMHPDRPVGRD